MKKYFAALILILCLCFSACGNNAGVSADAAKSPVSLAEAEVDAEADSEADPEEITGAAISEAEPEEATAPAVEILPEEKTVYPEPVYYEPVDSNSSGAGIIYLTFDDGPCGYTDDVLEILARYDVKATFFLTGQHPGSYPYITSIQKAGHSIGVHSFTHVYSACYKSEDAFYAECEKMEEIIGEYAGIKPNLLRFPGGSSNTVSKKYVDGLMTSLSKGVEERGYTYFDWNVASGDTSKDATVNTIIANVERGIKKHQSNVVLMHDFKINSLKALPYIIEWGQENGYEFRALTPDSPTCHQRINN